MDNAVTKKKTVTVIYRFLPQYRVDFFNQLRERLREDGIRFNLVYGKNRECPKQDEVDLDWGISVKNRNINILGQSFLWQPIPNSVYDSDLIILLQENRILSNYTVTAKARRRGIKMGLWGHGVNLQAERGSLGNRWKRMVSTNADWWFAYTEGVKSIVESMSFPSDRITVVQNAIDTQSLVNEMSRVRADELEKLKSEIGLQGTSVGIYCGRFYKEKRIEFLLEACRRLKYEVPEFEAIIVGSGADQGLVEAASSKYPWIHSVGAKFGMSRVRYFLLSDIFLMPGAVGLAVLDGFALRTPMITTKYAYHGPEVEYIENNNNGIITADNLDAFVEGVKRVLQSKELLARLRDGCGLAVQRYTLSAMVENFATGIKAALHAPRRNEKVTA